jgi:hypothetical protein
LRGNTKGKKREETLQRYMIKVKGETEGRRRAKYMQKGGKTCKKVRAK